ncbi:tRNA(Arg) A34 adenosine deaminase TadA [Microbulbifer donghaiensis]|uniref:tRNA(Arg) A34 adenosine deaminase TadA n=1 Tax=Microbulbifer donghaiensis TaxID=494016 RepID=A0A1M5H901_9GAMM|nr:nucleoside deaminase [Microbulbifer donghaiensis]SHG12460.1 tRNA(Arg) A34 adenosine deaminase TadA [Microbulbifer donghaiensis]
MGNTAEQGPQAAQHRKFLARAVELARDNVTNEGGRPFGAVLVRDGEIIAEGVNTIHINGDLTGHAELEAMRRATIEAGEPRLDGCVIYASGHPCPMCLSAMYLSGVSAVYYACSQEDGDPYGLSTADIYHELTLPPQQRQLPMAYLPLAEGPAVYRDWQARKDRE